MLNLRSAMVEKGAFTFQSPFDHQFVAILVAMQPNGHTQRNCIVEAGTIELNMSSGKVSGTPLNDGFNDYLREVESLGFAEKMEPLQKSIRNAADTQQRDSLKAVLKAEFTRYQEGMSKASQTLFEANPNNLLGIFAAKNIISTNPSAEQLAILKSKASQKVDEAAGITSKLKQMQSSTNTGEGKKYADFDCYVCDAGKDGKLSDIIGDKVALIDFWASWCAPCRKEIADHLIPLATKYKNKGVVIVGINVSDTEEKHNKAASELGINYPQVIDTQKKAGSLYGINAIPQIMLIGRDGTILGRDLRGENIEKAILKALE